MLKSVARELEAQRFPEYYRLVASHADGPFSSVVAASNGTIDDASSREEEDPTGVWAWELDVSGAGAFRDVANDTRWWREVPLAEEALSAAARNPPTFISVRGQWSADPAAFREQAGWLHHAVGALPPPVIDAAHPCAPEEERGVRHHALIILFRDREKHLAEFIEHMTAFWAAGDPANKYHVVVVEQDDRDLFNRAWLFDAGLHLAELVVPNLRCAYCHDVDLLPLEGVSYAGCDVPIHLSSEMDHFKWGVAYKANSGGVFGARIEDWKSVNGMSVEYVGWGGEDDDLFERMRINGFTKDPWEPHRPPSGHGRFHANHAHNHVRAAKPTGSRDDASTPFGVMYARLEELKRGSNRWKFDGLSSLRFNVTKRPAVERHGEWSVHRFSIQHHANTRPAAADICPERAAFLPSRAAPRPTPRCALLAGALLLLLLLSAPGVSGV